MKVNERMSNGASKSYPGLYSHKKLYLYQAWLEPKDYNPLGFVETQPDKSTYFGWQVVEEGE